jgi:hypothetical protein
MWLSCLSFSSVFIQSSANVCWMSAILMILSQHFQAWRWTYFNRICKMCGPLGEESLVKWPGEESMRRLQVQTPQYVTVAGKIHAQQPACAHWVSHPITPSCIPPFSPSRNSFVPALNVVSQRYRFCLCSLSLPHWLIHKCTYLYILYICDLVLGEFLLHLPIWVQCALWGICTDQ